jgi:DNA polymerase-3 subunit alpha
MVPNELHMTIDRALEVSLPLRQRYETDARIKQLFDMQREPRMPRHCSTHERPVLWLTNAPVAEYVPLSKKRRGHSYPIYMGTLEDWAFLKWIFWCFAP